MNKDLFDVKVHEINFFSNKKKRYKLNKYFNFFLKVGIYLFLTQHKLYNNYIKITANYLF